jgi:hypothetical protein
MINHVRSIDPELGIEQETQEHERFVMASSHCLEMMPTLWMMLTYGHRNKKMNNQ